MQVQMISLFNKSLLQTAWETDANKHYGSPKSTAEGKMLFKHLLTQDKKLVHQNRFFVSYSGTEN